MPNVSDVSARPVRAYVSIDDPSRAGKSQHGGAFFGRAVSWLKGGRPPLDKQSFVSQMTARYGSKFSELLNGAQKARLEGGKLTQKKAEDMERTLKSNQSLRMATNFVDAFISTTGKLSASKMAQSCLKDVIDERFVRQGRRTPEFNMDAIASHLLTPEIARATRDAFIASAPFEAHDASKTPEQALMDDISGRERALNSLQAILKEKIGGKLDTLLETRQAYKGLEPQARAKIDEALTSGAIDHDNLAVTVARTKEAFRIIDGMDVPKSAKDNLKADLLTGKITPEKLDAIIKFTGDVYTGKTVDHVSGRGGKMAESVWVEFNRLTDIEKRGGTYELPTSMHDDFSSSLARLTTFHGRDIMVRDKDPRYPNDPDKILPAGKNRFSEFYLSVDKIEFAKTVLADTALSSHVIVRNQLNGQVPTSDEDLHMFGSKLLDVLFKSVGTSAQGIEQPLAGIGNSIRKDREVGSTGFREFGEALGRARDGDDFVAKLLSNESIIHLSDDGQVRSHMRQIGRLTEEVGVHRGDSDSLWQRSSDFASFGADHPTIAEHLLKAGMAKHNFPV